MGVLSDIDRRFAELAGGKALESAFAEWRSRRLVLGQFQRSEEMFAYLREQRGEYEDRDRIVWALCLEARAEAKTQRKEPGRSSHTASDLLLGLFAAGLWRVFEEVRSAGVLAAHEIEAELVLGFWEAVHSARSHQKISGYLVNKARHRAWAAAKEESRAASPDESVPAAPYEADEDPDWSDPWILLCWAESEGAINEVQTELVFWTRLCGEPLEEIAETLGLDYTAAKLRRIRAEKRLQTFLEENRHRYPPDDPEVVARVATRAFSHAASRDARVGPAHFLRPRVDT